MHVVRVSAVADADGMLRLTIPVDSAGGEYDLAVVLAPKPAPARPKTPDELGWPPGYFENVIGSIDDDTFVAPPRHPPRPVESIE